jgi:S-adenosylmethionine synthetase
MMNIQSLPENHFFFASESVTEGHPDKLCDSLSDTVLDACLTQDPNSFVACEAVCKGNMVMLAGEITTNAKVDYKQVILERIKEVGYDDVGKGLDYKNCEVLLYIQTQSKEIAQSVHQGKLDEDLGAGDQGHMFGYATNETKELMPFSHLMALRLSDKLTELRKTGEIKWLRPDGKTQVTVEYIKEKDGMVRPLRFHNILISTQHDEDVTNETIRRVLEEKLIRAVCPPEMIDSNTKLFINPSGIFTFGGPGADAGLTGRKIIVDTYGGWGAHGGGAFSGKDPSKVDRSAAYAARWIAKSIVHAGLCKRALVQIAYSIGVADPLSVNVDTFGTIKEGMTEKDLFNIIVNNFDLKPGSIIKDLNLKTPIFAKTSSSGHFGRELPEFLWEKPRVLKL